MNLQHPRPAAAQANVVLGVGVLVQLSCETQGRSARHLQTSAEHDLAISDNFFDEHWRPYLIAWNAVGIKHGDAFDRWKPEPPIPAFATRRLVFAIRLGRSHAVMFAVRKALDGRLATVRHRVEICQAHLVNATVATNPQIARIVFQNAIDQFIEKPLFTSKHRKPSSFEPRETRFGSNPNCSFGILMQRPDLIA